MNNNNFTASLPNHIYYTLNFRNNGVAGEAEDAKVDYLEVRNNPYILQPDLYACSIIRFSLTTATLPIFIPQMAPDFSNDPASPEYQKTIYSFTMTYNNTNVREYVRFIPQTALLQYSQTAEAALTNPYYYVYQAAQFIVMLNDALARCFATILPGNGFRSPVYLNWIDKESRAIFYGPRILVQEPGYASQPSTYGAVAVTIANMTVGAVSGAGTVLSPWVATLTVASPGAALVRVGQSLSGTAGTGSVFGGAPTRAVVTAVTTVGPNDVVTYEVVGGTTPIAGTVTNVIFTNPLQLEVWANTALFNLLSSFQAFKVPFAYNTQATDNGKHFRFQWWNLYNSREQTVETFVPPDLLGRAPVSTEYVAINESYSVVPLWNPVKSIVFTTALLPVLPELVSQAQSLGFSTSFTNAGNNANVQNVLTDFEVQLENGEETRPVVYYTPTAEYRMVDLQSNQPVYGIQLSVNWRNKFGSLIPLNLGTDGNAQIKLLFRRRDWAS